MLSLGLQSGTSESALRKNNNTNTIALAYIVGKLFFGLFFPQLNNNKKMLPKRLCLYVCV